MTMKRILIIIIFCHSWMGWTTAPLQAQIAHGGKPWSQELGLTEEVPELRLPAWDNDSLRLSYEQQGIGNAVASPMSMDISPTTHGRWDSLENGQLIWRLTLISPTATALAFSFDRFALGKGSRLFCYQGDNIYGGFSDFHQTRNGEFFTAFLSGNPLTLELNLHRDQLEELQLHLSLIHHRFTNPTLTSNDQAGLAFECHNNVNCQPWQEDWCKELRSVVKLYFRDEEDGPLIACSGSIIHTESGEPLILTAFHCGSDVGFNPESWMIYFNFQSLTCNPTAPANDRMVVTGVEIVGGTGEGFGGLLGVGCPDLALLRLLDPFPYHFNTYWNGWELVERQRDLSSQAVTVIHHPMGDLKKVTEAETYKLALSGDEECFNARTFNGTIEFGSSGGPTFNENHRVIGAIHAAGGEGCDLDYFLIGNLFFAQQFGLDWDGHVGTSNTHIGVDPIEECIPLMQIYGELFPGRDWQIQNQITLQAREIETLALPFPQTNIMESPVNMSIIEQSDYVFRAEDRVTLRNFSVEHGNRFRAIIGGCEPFETECGFNYAPPRLAAPQAEATAEEELSFQVYPNPATDKIVIEANVPFSWQLYDSHGRLLATSTGKAVDRDGLSLKNFPPGVYLLFFNTSMGSHTQKIRKQ
mgnify:CR=1 FL=1